MDYTTTAMNAPREGRGEYHRSFSILATLVKEALTNRFWINQRLGSYCVES